MAGNYQAGLIIHEGQLTYPRTGLSKILDLGVWWREQTGLPLPLGGNAIRRSLGDATMLTVTQAVRDSISTDSIIASRRSSTRCSSDAIWTRAWRTNSLACT